MRRLTPIAMAVGMTVAGGARADQSARLVYSRTTESACPDEDALRDAVKTLLGRDPFVFEAQLTVVVQITKRGDLYHEHVEIVDQQSLAHGVIDRDRPERSCPGVVELTALDISMALEPKIKRSEGPPAPRPPEPSEPPAPAAPPVSSKPPAPAPVAPSEPPPVPLPSHENPPRGAGDRSSLRLAVGIDALVTAGFSPDVAPGMAVFLDVRQEAISVGLEVQGDLSLPATPDRSPGRVQSGVVAGSLVPCVRLGFAFACPVVQVGWLEAWGPSSAGSPSVGVGGRVGGEWSLSPHFFVRVHANALAELLPPSFLLSETVVYRTWVVTGQIGAGLGTYFP